MASDTSWMQMTHDAKGDFSEFPPHQWDNSQIHKLLCVYLYSPSAWVTANASTTACLVQSHLGCWTLVK